MPEDDRSNSHDTDKGPTVRTKDGDVAASLTFERTALRQLFVEWFPDWRDADYEQAVDSLLESDELEIALSKTIRAISSRRRKRPGRPRKYEGLDADKWTWYVDGMRKTARVYAVLIMVVRRFPPEQQPQLLEKMFPPETPVGQWPAAKRRAFFRKVTSSRDSPLRLGISIITTDAEFMSLSDSARLSEHQLRNTK